MFSLSARSPAQIMAYNKMIGQLQDAGNTTTVAYYLDLLSGAFLVSGLQSTVRLKRASSPKLIVWNNGIVSAINRYSFHEAQADAAWWGRLVENAVGAHILNSSPALLYELNCWREKNFEIDFCITTGGDRVGLEVKSGRLDKVSALAQFARKYPRSKTIVIGTGGMKLDEFFSSDISSML